MVRDMTAQLTGPKLSDIRAIPAEIGGGFGGKTIVYLEPLALVLSRKSGRPVKMVMSREEVFRATGPTSGSSSTVKIGATKDGKITAVQGDRTACRPAPFRARRSAAPWDARLRPTTSPTCRSPASTWSRTGPRSRPIARRVRRSALSRWRCTLDELARALKMDPLVLRQKNAAKEGTKTAYGPTFRRIGYEETLQAALEHPHYKAPLGPNQGRGVASGFWFNAGGEFERAGQHQRGRHGRGGDRPSRHRRLARLDGEYRRRAARHRLPPGAGPDRRHELRSASAR